MRRPRRFALLIATLAVAACDSGGADSASNAPDGESVDAAGLGGAGGSDTSSGDPDTGSEDVTAAAVDDASTGSQGTEDATDAGASVDAGPVVEVPPWGLAFEPSELDGLFVFGITSDPMSALSLIGQSVAGVSSVVVKVDLADDLAKLRMVESTGIPIPSDVGVVESYPASVLEDGRVLIDFRAPVASLEVQLYAGCTYALSKAAPSGPPLYADDLITWPMQETYTSSASCTQGGLPNSVGVNVHYLRRRDANPGFEPRDMAKDVPFGYFLAGDPAGMQGGTVLDRMPLPADPTLNGSARYFVSQNLPEDLMPAVDAVFTSWNDVVESVTGVRPLSYERATEDIVPWDPRYRTITWDATQTVGAVAPFVSDPITGEMFSTSVILWIGDIQLMVASYVDFLEKNPDAPWVGYGADSSALMTIGPADMGDDSALPPRVLRRHVFDQRPFDLGIVRDVWLRNGMSKTPEELSLDVVAEFLVHEVGHNFGLRHNFKGSIDRDGHPADAPSSTVMDYIIGMGKPGLYDVDAIRYGYGAGAERTDYLYCTDEDVYADPGCAQWDFGHPILFALQEYDAVAASVPFGEKAQTVQNESKQQGWNQLFSHLRDFMNSDYEGWDPDAPLDTFGEALGRVVCEGDCGVNPWLRGNLVNYLLRTKHKSYGGMGGSATPYPPLDEAQATQLFETLYGLVVDAAQPLDLRTTIVDRLAKAELAGSSDVLVELQTYFVALEAPTADEAAVLQAIQAVVPGN